MFSPSALDVYRHALVMPFELLSTSMYICAKWPEQSGQLSQDGFNYVVKIFAFGMFSCQLQD